LTIISLSNSSYSDSLNIYKVSTASSIGSVPLIKETQVATTEFDAPIHRQVNRGPIQETGVIMTLTAKVNSTIGPSVTYTGFPAVTPSLATANSITITPNSVVDYYGTGNANSDFYLTSKNIITASGLVAGTDMNTLTATQTFKNLTTSTALADFYYDTPVTTGPTGSINSISISNMTKVSGASIYNNPSGTAVITIDASANNMGTYFYRSPLITYNYTINGTLVASKSETNLANVRASDINNGNMFTNGNLNFTTPNTLTNVTSMTSISVNAVAKNIFGESLLTGKTLSVITDAASITFANTMNQSSIPSLSLTVAVIGRRIWSAPIVSNNCPDLLYDGNMYYTYPYDDSWDITSTNQLSAGRTINTSTELMIKDGLFTTTTAAYSDYSGYAGNSGINYSGVARTGYRFVTFCWKVPPRSGAGYKGLSFTFNSINNLTPATATSISTLGINGTTGVSPRILVFYAFQDVAAPTYVGSVSGGYKYNTYWLNGNIKGSGGTVPNLDAIMYKPNPTNSAFTYGYYGCQTAAISPISGSTTTLPVFMPSIVDTNDSSYLYLRIGIPMYNTNIQFGSVSATLSA